MLYEAIKNKDIEFESLLKNMDGNKVPRPDGYHPCFQTFVSSGISDHEIILADCYLKPAVCKKPPRTIYLWIKVDWNKIRLLASEFS